MAMSVTKKQQISLMERSVVYVCRGVMMGKRCGISAAAFSKRVSLRYQVLREYGNIPKHRRPSLEASCLKGLIAFIYMLPRDIRLADALEGMFVGCIEYHRLKRKSPRRPVGYCGRKRRSPRGSAYVYVYGYDEDEYCYRKVDEYGELVE